MRNQQPKASDLENNRKVWFDFIHQKSWFFVVEDGRKMRILPNYTGKIVSRYSNLHKNYLDQIIVFKKKPLRVQYEDA